MSIYLMDGLVQREKCSQPGTFIESSREKFLANKIPTAY